MKTSPPGGECDYVWNFRDGVYEALFIERNLVFPEFSTTSRQEFETWWKNDTLKKYTARLEYTWKFLWLTKRCGIDDTPKIINCKV